VAQFLAQKEASIIGGGSARVRTFHGFDSFRGLPLDWDNGQVVVTVLVEGSDRLAFPAGKFDLGGVAPVLLASESSASASASASSQAGKNNNKNIMLHPGWFEDTVQPFFETHTGPIAFCHADVDLYESTIAFLHAMCQRSLPVPGSVICFDEYWCNYPGWQHGEYKAWMEVCAQYRIDFDYLCYHAPHIGLGRKLLQGQDAGHSYGYQSVSVKVTQVMGEQQQ
jgi:hypothetical protein